MDSERLVGIQEMAKAYRRERTTIYRWIEMDGFPTRVCIVNGGKAWRLGDVETWRKAAGKARRRAEPIPV